MSASRRPPLVRLAALAFALAACASEAGSRPGVLDPAGPARDAGGDADPGGSLVTGERPDGAAAPADAAPVDAPRPTVDVTTPPRDAARDAPIDVAVDAGGPEEVCGNGVDDDADGRVDEGCPVVGCAAPPPARSRVWFVGATAPASAANAIGALGLTLAPGEPTDDDLPASAAIVMILRGAPSEGRGAALRAWVDGGGGLMTLIIGSGSTGSDECDAPNALLDRMGLRYTCTAPVPYGPLTELLPHPITEGLVLADTPFVNGRGVAARPGVASEPVARIGPAVVGRTTTSGCGRVFAWGDEHVSFASYGAATRPFWERSLRWLTGR